MDAVEWEGADLSKTVMSPEMIAALDFSGAGAPPQNAPTQNAPPQNALQGKEAAAGGEEPPAEARAEERPTPADQDARDN